MKPIGRIFDPLSRSKIILNNILVISQRGGGRGYEKWWNFIDFSSIFSEFSLDFHWVFLFLYRNSPSPLRCLEWYSRCDHSVQSAVGRYFHSAKNSVEKYFRKIFFDRKKLKFIFWKKSKIWKIFENQFFMKNYDFHWKNFFTIFEISIFSPKK